MSPVYSPVEQTLRLNPLLLRQTIFLPYSWPFLTDETTTPSAAEYHLHLIEIRDHEM